jgi:hypothetical protein
MNKRILIMVTLLLCGLPASAQEDAFDPQSANFDNQQSFQGGFGQQQPMQPMQQQFQPMQGYAQRQYSQMPQMQQYNGFNQMQNYGQQPMQQMPQQMQQFNGFNQMQNYGQQPMQQMNPFQQRLQQMQQMQGMQGMQPQMGGQRPNLFQMLMGGGQAQQAPVQKPPENPFSPQSLLRTFLGGTPSGTPGAAGDQQALGTAQSYCQTARDQASQAEACEGRTKYGDKGARMSAASEAQNHANAARGAANSATSAAAGHFSAAQDAAAQARNAADRAQAAADRARYNASTAN